MITELDSKSRFFAERNIKGNGLQARIKILASEQGGKILLPTAQLRQSDSIDFVMTNPPFYESEADMLDSAKKKQRPPNSACTGAAVEMITPGGEVQFVSQMILESLSTSNREQVQWFSSMLGRLSSVGTVVDRLKSKGCLNYAVTEFIQGQKTRRWAVAWSWQSFRPTTKVSRGIPGFEKKLLPFPNEFEIYPHGLGADEIGPKLDVHLASLDLQWQWKAHLKVGLGMTKGDVWSRRARRRREKENRGEEHEEDHRGQNDSDEEPDPALVFKISLVSTGPPGNVKIVVRWVQGEDSVLFESFCGWLKRKLDENS